ncbi:MAG: putative cryptococcal mannosyltransferase 1 [Prokaryotic dsDNA virus sp.]|mgnify:CR=1 FL=1|nr:MAG: putative cryptococcal mannosyltransferase 1 [Prokaryotic dsDNA virus sp.]|tara:strand:- start:23821 stop:24534 length:714 start_codon:yes stop_codon:yes gene_type:complete
MRVLICSIIRNRKEFLFNWKDLILCLADENPEITFDLSVYENDSTDGTQEYLKQLLPELRKELNEVVITMGHEQTPYFPSVKDEQRCHQLATARNQCLEQVLLEEYDKVIFFEPDIDFEPEDFSVLLNTDDDICSPYSLLPSRDWIYDCWATRISFKDQEFTGPIYDEMPNRLDVVSTFNCFCVYNAKPFIEGARFSGINPITKSWDCDTTAICAEFNRRGYTKVGLYKIPLTHFRV